MPNDDRMTLIQTTPVAFYTIREMMLFCGYKHRTSMRRLLRQLGVLVEIAPRKHVVPLSLLEDKCSWLWHSVNSVVTLRAQMGAGERDWAEED